MAFQSEEPDFEVAVAVLAPGLEGSESAGKDGHATGIAHVGPAEKYRKGSRRRLGGESYLTCSQGSIFDDQNAHHV